MLELPALLSADDLAAIRADLQRTDRLDGSATAGPVARQVKRNLEVSGEDPAIKRIGDRVTAALTGSRAFREFAMPHKIRMPIVSVYEPGMEYGNHVDAPIMGDGPIHATRTDLSVTVFLSDLASYDGGGLVLETATGPRHVRLEAGGAVVYPTHYIHRVEPVTRGTRLAVITWMQSRVRDHEERQILYDLAAGIRALPENTGKAERLLLHHVFTRLYQKWTAV
ncbi:Fe2+-dependent dioxygenase [Thalassobaculum sp.]|uniref:Fe2+-dependent dioxygenase n=1 Tax=Thalassobaculum sp. TaxID=2022740 RepID=UPI0032ED7EA2